MNDIKLLIFSIIAYILSSLLTIVVSENIADVETHNHTLHDIVHSNFSIFPSEKRCNYIVYTYIGYHIIRWGLEDHKKISLYFLSLACLLLMRIITFTVTQTPPPRYEDDKWRINHCKRNVLSHIGISFNDVNYTCIDNMFSGHAAHIVVAASIILLYSNNNIERIIVSIITLISLFSIVSGRLHYTSDVVVSTIVSFLTVHYLATEIPIFEKIINTIM